MEGFYVLDAQHNYICTERFETIARQIAEELGGDYIPIED